jgi:serine/threonine protein kinase
MGLHLVVIAGPDKGRVFPLEIDDWLLLGRSRAAEGKLNDLHVSKIHCKVECKADGVFVIDQESTGGTFVNGARVTEQLLHPGDVIRLGETQLRLQDATAPLGDEAEGKTLALPAAAQPARTGPPDLAAELPGKALSHYRLGPPIAAGRTGVVFHAQDGRDGSKVAVKVLAPEFIHNDEDVQRFVRAMRTMLPLRHPNLVAVYGAGKAGPYCWSAMEYVEGESLAQLLDHAGPGGVLDWRRALRYATHVARGLDYAHRNSVVHRNLTPHNVLVRRSDEVAKLGDLMLAKALGGMWAETITRPGEVVGEVHYLSPEGTGGGAEVDARSDLFSLGALAYALLSGRPPFEGDSTVDILLCIREQEPVRPTQYQPAVPGPFEAIVLKLLQKRPQDRFQTAAEVVRELEGLMAAHSVPG